MSVIETDYLLIGAGLSGMAFADSLIAESDADVVMVDRRHRPGGHWNDAYPFVGLHMPAANYGVNSRSLGRDSIDEAGPNAGFYERATGVQICDYFHRVLEEQLLPSGQVRFFGMCDYLGDGANGHRFVSRLTGEVTTVRVRRKMVDATYLESSVPSTHTPVFDAEPGVRLLPPNDLVRLTGAGSGYTVMGAGKTAMDVCQWLLDNGVAPTRIRWIRPRDAWLLDRAFYQPLTQVTTFIEGLSLQVEAAARAGDVAELFPDLEACGQLVRLDPSVEPTMFHGASVSGVEMEQLRRIENVVRKGRVVHLGADRIVMDEGSVPTDEGQVHVDCTAAGLRMAPARPIFEPDRITLQQVRQSSPSFNAALLGFIESTRDDDVAEKNRICPPNPYPDAAVDWISWTHIGQRVEALWSNEPDLEAWMERSRLHLARGYREQRHDLRMRSALARLTANREPAIRNLERLLAQSVTSEGS
jgi:hypothetical protein